MPWKEVTAMSLRLEFVQLAMKDGANIRQLCRDFRISRKTGYKWLMRFQESDGDPNSLVDRSRRPHRSPGRTPAAVEEAVLQVREEHPAWGGRKIRAYLQRRGESSVPSPSTITEILRRQGLIATFWIPAWQRARKLQASSTSDRVSRRPACRPRIDHLLLRWPRCRALVYKLLGDVDSISGVFWFDLWSLAAV